MSSRPYYDQGPRILTSDEQLGWAETSSGLILPADVAANRDLPIAVDLFCGCGGFSLGFAQAGFHVAAACDNSVDATITYLYNLGEYPVQMYFVEPEDQERFERTLQRRWKKNKLARMPVSGANKHAALGNMPGCEHFFFGDVSKLTGQHILDALGMRQGEVAAVVGGPPCQGFTRANRKAGPDDPRNLLVFEFARLVVEIQPKAVVMENVPEMLKMTTPDGVPILDEITRILEDGGMGTRDALRKSIAGTAGCGAAFRGKPEKRKKKRPKTKAKTRPAHDQQAELFG